MLGTRKGGKMNKKEERWRIAKERGIDGLEKDLKLRGALNLPVVIPPKATRELYQNLTERVMNTVKTVALWTLYEQGWGKIRLKRFEEEMDRNSLMCMELDRYGEHYVQLSEMAAEMQEKCGVSPNMSTLETIEKENREATSALVKVEAVVEALRETGCQDAADLLLEKMSKNKM